MTGPHLRVTPAALPPSWHAFLSDVDGALPCRVELHCLGGFVAARYYKGLRQTYTLDYVDGAPREAERVLQRIAGPRSTLARKHNLHVQHVRIATLPASYAERLTELFPGMFERLRLLALEPHDLALSKLARNFPVDRRDVAQLATAVPLDAGLLRSRYTTELRPIVTGDAEVLDRTLERWIEAYCRPPR